MMTDFSFVLSAIAFILSMFAFVLSLWSIIGFMALKKSTHRIEWKPVPVDEVDDNQLDLLLKKQQSDLEDDLI